MDRSYDHPPEDDDSDLPPRQTEAGVRATLDQSRRDIDVGRTVLLQPVLDRLRLMAEQTRQRHATDGRDQNQA